jgi:AraC-like DNA-binding protein
MVLKNTFSPHLFKMLCFYFFFLSQLISAQVKIEVEVLSPFLDANKPLFVALDYNKWNPGDPVYILNKEKENLYSIVLENVPSSFEYKFTQGSWMLVEGTPSGEGLPNRSFDRNVSKSNIVRTKILGWEKQVAYDIIVDNIPENTPRDAEIFVSGNFNNWESGNVDYQLKRNIQGHYTTRIYSDMPKLEFKFTRGTWESVEARESGKARPNRIIYRSSDINNKSVNVTIEGWEDLLGTLHVYSLFDFLLLFAVFQGILLVVAIPLIQNANVEANRWLIFSIVISSLSILFYLMSNFQVFVNRFPRIVIIHDFIYFIYAPIFYFYLIKLLYHVKFLPSKWYLHFLPFLIQFFVYLPYLIQNDKTFLLDLMEQKPMLTYTFGGTGILGLLWNLYYWNLFRKTIVAYKLEFQTNLSYEQNLNYLSTVSVIQFVVLCFWAFSIVAILVGHYFNIDNIRLFENSVDLTWLAFSIITYFVGYFAIHQSETFKAQPQKISIFDDLLETAVNLNQKAVTNDPEHIKKDIEKLEKYMADYSPYKNPKVSLSELASQIQIPSHLLSKIINDHYHQNFFDFINHYRIEEFKKMVIDPKNQNLTFLGLAYEVGFNSKTAFNRSFKKITNQTPREYLDSIKLH